MLLQKRLMNSRMVELQILADRLRLLVLDSVYRAGSGHIGGSFSAAEILVALYFEKMRVEPLNPKWEERDRFILGKGHIAPALYAVLAMAGYFPEEELDSLRKIDSRLQGHPDMNKTPGVDMTTGSLGQGLSAGLGMALASRILKQNYHTFVLMGDGELQEGQVWEAALAAAHMKAPRLVAIVDYNKVQLDGFVADVMDIAPLAEKWNSFGWNVIETDGHQLELLCSSLDDAITLSRLGPVVILAHTTKGKGVSFMENNAFWHGNVPSESQFRLARKELQGRLGGD